MRTRPRRSPFTAALVVALVSAAIVPLAERPARAWSVDVGAEGGLQKRHLAQRSYDAGFGWQFHAEFALLPPILLIGPYATLANATPNAPTLTTGGNRSDKGSDVTFRTVGMRAQVRLPVPGRFKPYGVAGLGWVQGDFPSQRLIDCCAHSYAEHTTANFVEFLIGAGLTWNISGKLAFTAEFDWRPTIAYKNDVYEKTLYNSGVRGPEQWPTAADPSRNGVSYTGMVGLALAL